MSVDPANCETCGIALSETEPVSPCTSCRSLAVIAAMPPEVLAWIDHAILGQHPLQGVMYVRAYRTTLAPYEAVDVIHKRYTQLRTLRPDDFSCAHETYWQPQT
jgi:hypothetical protein